MFLQYYEMSYGLNVEMHKQVSAHWKKLSTAEIYVVICQTLDFNPANTLTSGEMEKFKKANIVQIFCDSLKFNFH